MDSCSSVNKGNFQGHTKAQLLGTLEIYKQEIKVREEKIACIEQILTERYELKPGAFVTARNKETGEQAGLSLMVDQMWPTPGRQVYWLANLGTGTVCVYDVDKWTFEVQEKPYGVPR